MKLLKVLVAVLLLLALWLFSNRHLCPNRRLYSLDSRQPSGGNHLRQHSQVRIPGRGSSDIEVTNEIKGTNWIWRSLLPMMNSTLVKQQRETINRIASETETARPTLSGSWTGADGNGNEQRFSFSRDGNVTWQIIVAGVTTVTGIHNDVDYTASPYRLDLSGFTSGPLAGLWLYGILEFEGDNSMRFDAGAGDPDDDTARPSTFSASTVTYDRME